MKTILLEAYIDHDDSFKLVFEENLKNENMRSTPLTRQRLNLVTLEPVIETLYPHNFNRENVRYCIYFNRNLIEMDLELKALEIALNDYILKNPIPFENVVENLITSKGFTIDSLVESVGVDISIIEKFVTNGELPKGTHGRMLAEKLDISTDELIDISHQRRKDWIASSKKTIE